MRSTSLRRARRAAVVAVALPALALSVAGCSGGSTSGGKGDDRAQRSGSSDSGKDGKDDGSGGGAAVPPLSGKQLKAALLKTGDVKGYRVQGEGKDALPLQNSISSDDPNCTPLTDVVDSRPKHARTAYVGANLVLGDGDLDSGAAIQQVLLASYAKGEAKQWLGELAKSLRSCASFEGKVGKGPRSELRVEPQKAADVGDDAVQFALKAPKGAKGAGAKDATVKDAAVVFTVVRTGGNTATYLSIGLSGAPDPVAKAVQEKQHEKLVAAAKH